MSTYILWDIDGTLIYNNANAGSLYVAAVTDVTGIRPTERVSNPHGMTEGQLLTELLVVNGHDAGLLPPVYERLEILAKEQHEGGDVREAAVGVAEALAAVTDRGWTNALLTGNGPLRARYKIAAAGIDPDLFDWEHSYFGHQAPTRHDLTALAREAHESDAIVIIGDTPKDGEAADSARIPFIAVASGAYSADELRETNAVVVLDDLVSGRDALLAAVDAQLPVALS